MAKSDKQKLKEKLWKKVSLYIRLKYSVDEYCKCYTCNVVNHYKEMQAGHFIPKAQGLAMYFNLENIRVQCGRCNGPLGSNGPEYYPRMVAEIGQEKVDELKRLSNTSMKINITQYMDMIEEIDKKLEGLE